MTIQEFSPSVASPAEAAIRAAEAGALLAAGAFGSALRASPEFVRLALAGDTLSADPAATAAIDAFRTRQTEVRVQLMFGTLDDAQRAELESLQAVMLACPSVAAYLAALADFQAVCRETSAVVSDQIGIDFAANCRAGGCCG